MKRIELPSDIAIRLENVSKTFHVRQYPSLSIREKITSVFKSNPLKKIEAVKPISFEINKGDFFGIIGRNGSGKSTLMNIISQVYMPDKGGKALINGKFMKLSLGVGFNGELTTRQNIYINASLLGLSFREIGKCFDEIIDFAELENFVDTPVKYYSRGMKTRLGFSIALHARSEIFLLDEVFGGVGDITFVRKAARAFNHSIVAGKTVVLISHSNETIRAHCNRAMLMEKGETLAIGTPNDIVNAYEYLTKVKSPHANEDNSPYRLA